MSPSSKDVETQMLLLSVSVTNQNKVLGSSAYILAEPPFPVATCHKGPFSVCPS